MKYCSAPAQKTFGICPTITSICPIYKNSCSTRFTGLTKQVILPWSKQLFSEEDAYNKIGVHFLSSGQALNFEINVRWIQTITIISQVKLSLIKQRNNSCSFQSF